MFINFGIGIDKTPMRCYNLHI